MSASANSAASLLSAAMSHCPLVAILRGVRPDEVVAIADALVDNGFALIEVPLNSPDPLASIAALAGRYAGPVQVGAGTVLTTADVANVAAAGGRLIISPNTDAAVIRASAQADLISLPGFFTPSEGFAALAAGSHGLKLFPAEGASPTYLRAQRAVLPRDVPVLAVGGVTPANLGEWMAAGADGAGLGSALYKPGMTAAQVGEQAAAYVAAWKAV
ncbi:MAG TPA: 2-dehydro-3-deoxy-6-phosphogalactonate aldolase [Novosphingobium sp.]|nr:2-dehydro-3-deoxy-6-phosphogalactonate aldolase [Novosphingobium sp.]